MARPTIRDIAIRAGVSATTVSKVLNGKGSISSQTTALVERIAKELGYRRDPALAALAEHRHHKRRVTRRIVIFTIRGYNWLKRYTEIFASCRRHGDELGYEVEEIHLESLVEAGETDIGRWCAANEFEAGIILTQTWCDMPDFQVSNQVPLIQIGNTLRGLSVPRVTCDDFNDLSTAYMKLHEAGYTRIGLCLGDSDRASDKMWSAAFLTCQHRIGRSQPELWHDDKQVQPWIDDQRPQAVICCTSIAYEEIEQVNRERKPDDQVLLIRVGWREEQPDRLGILHQMDDLARIAVAQVDGMLRSGSIDRTVNILIPGRWIGTIPTPRAE